MPTARPIIMITLTMKNDWGMNVPTAAMTPILTNMATKARIIDTPAAIRAPKTNTSTSSVMGRPIISARVRSSSAVDVNSCWMLAPPTVATSKPGTPWASTREMYSSMPSPVSAATLERLTGIRVVCRSVDTSCSAVSGCSCWS